MDKILQLLGADKLNEDTQVELKEKLQTVIEVEAKKLSEATLTEEKERLVEEMEQKFEDYKDKITTKFSNFVDTVLEEELQIPEKVLEYARKGELYHDLIEQFKVRLGVDQGLLDEESRTILKEARDEIVKNRKDLDKTLEENLTIRGDAQEMAAELYLYKKCEGLTEAQRKHVFNILEGITDVDEIDRKFAVIAESERFDPVNVGDEDDPEKVHDKVSKKNKKTSDPKNNEDQVEEGDDKDEKGKGLTEMDDEDDDEDDDEKKKMEEENNPFAKYSKTYLQVLRENKL